MARCTCPAIALMAVGALVMLFGQVPGVLMVGKSGDDASHAAQKMMDNLGQMNPEGGPQKSFVVDSSVCEGINMMWGIGIFFDKAKVATSCKDITVKVTFTPAGEPDSVRHPVKFYDNCTQNQAKVEAPDPYQKFLADPHRADEDPDDDAPDGGDDKTQGGINMKGTFHFLTKENPQDACNHRDPDDPLCQKVGQHVCVQGTYHVESSEPVAWIDLNEQMMAGLGGLMGMVPGLIGMMMGASGILLSFCCGLCCCGAGGIVACMAQSPPPPVPLLAGQDAVTLVPGHDHQMRTLAQ